MTETDYRRFQESRERMALALNLPLRTVSEANTRDHWAVKSARVKAHRDTTTFAARGVMGGETGYLLLASIALGGRVAVMLTRVAPRDLDDDNLRSALKAVRDGVADSLGVNDRDPRVRWEYAQRRGKANEYAVEIRIEGVE